MRIVTFNIHWLQGSRFQQGQPGPPRPAVLKKAGRVLRELAADLLFVQELQSPEAAAALAAECRMARWLYAAGRMLRPQFGGAIMTCEPAWTLLDASEPPIERFAIKAVRREPGFQFTAACVHLRSDKFDAPERASRGRYDEMLSLLESDPVPDVVGGDFNTGPGSELWAILGEGRYADAAELTGQSRAATTLAGDSHDRFWVARRTAGSVLRVQILPAEQLRLAKTDYLSDHLPVIVELDM